MEDSQRLAILLFVTLTIAMVTTRLSRRYGLRQPPGPVGYPLVGYLKSIEPPVWKTFYRWSLEYGSAVIRFNILGTNMIVLNTLQSATDLLEKRSSIYSDRPVSGMIMLRELVGFDWSIAAAPYGPRWRAARKVMQHSFNRKAVTSYQPIQTRAVHRLLSNLQQTPTQFRKYTRFLFGSLAIEVAYGLEVSTGQDSLVTTAEYAMWASNQCRTPGAYLVDFIPILKYVPAWFPGAKFKRQAREWKKAVDAMANVPYDAIKNQRDLPECAAKKMLQQRFTSDYSSEGFTQSQVIRDSLGTVFGAATDTSTAALDGFFLAMTIHREMQHKAQDSIDHICRGRLPEFSDIDSLPYLHALLKECLRCYTIAPYGLPHMVTREDTYDGYYIPAGSTVIANIWAILHDPEVYPDPEQFNPERFLRYRDGVGVELDPDVLDPAVAAFGFGRRICPGRHLAYESLWLSMASVLAVFDISKAVDDFGKPVTPSGEFTETFVCPKDFQCVIQPRSQEHDALISSLTGDDIGQ